MEINSHKQVLASLAASKKPATLLAYLQEKDPELAKKTAETVNNMTSVLANLKNAKTDVAAQRKAAAMQKVARIKEAIQALKLSSIVDPKMVARMAARLAKELAQAVKEYTSAGGSTAEIGSVSAPTASSAAAPQEKTAATDAAAPAAEAVPIEQTAEPIAENDIVFADPEVEEATPEGLKTYENRQNDGSKTKSDGKDDDRAFMDSVRDAIDELRKLLKAQKKSPWLGGGGRDERAENDAEKSLREAERLLAPLSAGSQSGLKVTA